jgi:hypothetical protein
MPVPNPEQTASLLSLLIYTFLDPIVFLAYRMPHLPHDQLPPLADYDYAKNLSKKALPVCPFSRAHHSSTHVSLQRLDPFISESKSHIFFRLLRIFREVSLHAPTCVVFILIAVGREYIILALMLVLQVSYKLLRSTARPVPDPLAGCLCICRPCGH